MATDRQSSADYSAEALQSIIDNKTKPPGSLGRIEALALQIGLFKQSPKPRMRDCQLTIFAGDHGIVESGVSAYPQEVTQQMVLNFLTGGAAANVFARTLGVNVQVVDAGVAGIPIKHSDLVDRRLGPGTANSVNEAAMTDEQFECAVEYGRELGGTGDVDAVCFGEMGIGNTSAATLLCHKILDLSLEALTGRGTGLDDDGLRHKREILTMAASRTSGKMSAERALTEFGGFEIAMMTGAMLGAASNRKLIIVDGFISTSAATAAIAIDATVKDAMVFAHSSAERGHAAVLAALDVRPLLNLELRLGEGTGALLAWPLVKSAAAMLGEMASFGSAGVSGPA